MEDPARLFCLRHSKNSSGAFGTLFNSRGMPFAVSLENEETLLPAGLHLCKRDFYHAGNYPTFEIQVAGRDRVLFHRLNWDYQSKGCIGIAESYEMVGDKPGIAASEKGFSEFWGLYKEFPEISLVVVEHYLTEEPLWLHLSQQA